MSSTFLAATGDYTSYLPIVIIAAVGIAIIVVALRKRSK